MSFVIVAIAEDGTTSVLGTYRGGHPFPSEDAAERVAELMRDPFSAIFFEGEVTVTPVIRSER